MISVEWRDTISRAGVRYCFFIGGVVLIAAIYGRDEDCVGSQTWLRHEQKRGTRGCLFDEELLGGAIVEDEDVQALLEGGQAMAVEGEDEGGREVRKV